MKRHASNNKLNEQQLDASELQDEADEDELMKDEPLEQLGGQLATGAPEVAKDRWLLDYLTGNGQLERPSALGDQDERLAASRVKKTTTQQQQQQQQQCLCPPGKTAF